MVVVLFVLFVLLLYIDTGSPFVNSDVMIDMFIGAKGSNRKLRDSRLTSVAPITTLSLDRCTSIE